MKLDRKQKTLITLIIIAVAFLAWQLYDMFFASDDNLTPTPVATSTPVTLQPVTQSAPTTTTTQRGIPTIPAASQPLAPAPSLQPAPKPIPVPVISPVATPTPAIPAAAPTPVTLTQPIPATAPPPPPQMTQMTLPESISPTQIQYLRLVNRYQIVRIKRLVVDEEAAIASSQEKIAQLKQQIAKIGGQTPSTASTLPTVASVTGYQLMYIDNQGGQWTATLSKNGRFREVSVGMVLADGTRVMKIDESGVVILQNGNYYLLNFYGTTHLTQFTAPAAKPIPRPVVIKSKVRTIHMRSPRHRPAPLICAANNKNCAAKTTLATNTGLQPTVINFPKLPANKTTPVTTLATTTTTSLPTAATLTSMTTTTTATTSTAPPLASAHAAPVSVTAQPQPPTTIVQNKTNAAPLQQPAPWLEPRPPTSLPLKTKHELSRLPLEKNKVAQQPENLFNSYSSDEKHLLASPAGYYTLQLIGNDRLSDLTDFIKAYKLENKAYTYHTIYLNKDWFVLIYGIYKTQEEALNAIKDLPAAAQQLKPWVRTLASVHEAIKSAPTTR